MAEGLGRAWGHTLGRGLGFPRVKWGQMTLPREFGIMGILPQDPAPQACLSLNQRKRLRGHPPGTCLDRRSLRDSVSPWRGLLHSSELRQQEEGSGQAGTLRGAGDLFEVLAPQRRQAARLREDSLLSRRAALREGLAELHPHTPRTHTLSFAGPWLWGRPTEGRGGSGCPHGVLGLGGAQK